MASTPHKHVRVALGLVALIPLLAACTGGGSTETSTESTAETTPATTTEATTTPATTASSSVIETTESSTAETSTKESGETSTSKPRMTKDVEVAYKAFSSLAPVELFEQFETCDPSGVEDSFACNGPEVGQFQFFDNASKATSTTQLLTELRSSRVVEDSGSKVVGWTTIGTMSIITVVDNDQGLVLQQMVSSDKIDPEERIYELGLSTPKDTEESSEETSASKN
ncbi:hypothetical protein, possibly secreted [Corynebacterium glutamicum MB001]|uniref:Beta-N-acetylglucosaminidase n=2 Tax=Corynebacterium TaxID=1716 RepID=Q8NS95_CORGL|nr:MULTISPECIES: hypothetical protein [Corynebacterium]AGT04777.1 hypothetical protein, possibly secreted [Corynebacterium glutamicum MB001]ASW13486.1 hypothetical protein cgc1_0894 [Corynebacterium glutamicum]NII97520.1 hypothetical protein [Corynebacterium glutamicum]QYO73017.1 hypothetical protein cgisf_0894 [Corynebacterium glutamicum]WBG75374.1 hypothetical protein O5J82_03930 [Corynebacterium glutamicum]